MPTTAAKASNPVQHFRRVFSQLGTPERARSEKAYLKSPLKFHGVTLPVIHAETTAFWKAHEATSAEEVRALVEPLFATEYHDLRSAGIGLLVRGRRLLGPDDVEWLIDTVREFANWAHVDWLATYVVAEVVGKLPRPAAELRKWARDESFWVRRTALLAMLPTLRQGEGNFDLFAELATPMLSEKEFFIRKAIGWVLREVSKKRPEWTESFVREHVDALSGLSFREATRRLPEESRCELEQLRAQR